MYLSCENTLKLFYEVESIQYNAIKNRAILLITGLEPYQKCPKITKSANLSIKSRISTVISYGGDGESRTRVRIKHHSDDYSLDHFVTFIQL